MGSGTRPVQTQLFFLKFAAGVVDTGGNLPPVYLDLRLSPQIFEKNRNDPNVIIRGLGEDDS